MMGPGETIAFIGLMIGVLGISAMLVGAYKARLRVKERELELRLAQVSNAEIAVPASQDDRIEQRLRVLERIATDHSTNLASQIEDLRKETVNS